MQRALLSANQALQSVGFLPAESSPSRPMVFPAETRPLNTTPQHREARAHYHVLLDGECEQMRVELQLVVPSLRVKLPQAVHAQLHELLRAQLLGAALVLQRQLPL